jgi:hypothetical protein
MYVVCKQVREILPPTGFDPRDFQPVASRYTRYQARYNRSTEINIINATFCLQLPSVEHPRTEPNFSRSEVGY